MDGASGDLKNILTSILEDHVIVSLFSAVECPATLTFKMALPYFHFLMN